MYLLPNNSGMSEFLNLSKILVAGYLDLLHSSYIINENTYIDLSHGLLNTRPAKSARRPICLLYSQTN